MRAALIALALLLTGCAAGGSNPLPPPAPPPAGPPSAVRPGVVVFTANWQQDTIGVGCGEDVPPTCAGTATWLTFPRPGTQGYACVDPKPNACLELLGDRLRVKNAVPGFPLISQQTFNATEGMSIEAVVSAICRDPGCFIGPVIFDGELDYGGLYLDAAADGVRVRAYRPAVACELPGHHYPAGTTVALRVDYDGAGYRFVVNGSPASAPGCEDDPLKHDPRAALFAGGVDGYVERLDVTIGK